MFFASNGDLRVDVVEDVCLRSKSQISLAGRSGSEQSEEMKELLKLQHEMLRKMDDHYEAGVDHFESSFFALRCSATC